MCDKEQKEIDYLKTFYGQTYARYIHWSTWSSNILNYIVILNSGMWAYFIVGYFSQKYNPNLLMIPIFVSSIILGGWRYYARYLDDQIASLYPDLVYCEIKFKIPITMGMQKYLCTNVKDFCTNAKPLKRIIEHPNLQPIAKHELFNNLAKEKKLGWRGLIEFSWLTVFILGIFSIIIVFFLITRGFYPFYILGVIGIILGFELLRESDIKYQQDPTDTYVKSMIDDYEKSMIPIHNPDTPQPDGSELKQQ